MFVVWCLWDLIVCCCVDLFGLFWWLWFCGWVVYPCVLVYLILRIWFG